MWAPYAHLLEAKTCISFLARDPNNLILLWECSLYILHRHAIKSVLCSFRSDANWMLHQLEVGCWGDFTPYLFPVYSTFLLSQRLKCWFCCLSNWAWKHHAYILRSLTMLNVTWVYRRLFLTSKIVKNFEKSRKKLLQVSSVSRE